MQAREPGGCARSPLETLLARADDAALDFLADRLLARAEIAPADAPSPAPSPREEPAPEVEG